MASPIKVEGVQLPGDNMDPDAIEAAAKSLSSTGTAVSNRGSAVLTSWQGLASSYQAPEQETLFTSMNPAKTAAESFGTDMGTTASALNTFASEVRTIKAEVAKIKSDALAFLGTIKDGKITVHHPAMMAGRASMPAHDESVDWDSDQGSVDKNNALIHRMNDQQEKLWTAERTCANALNAICGAAPISAADPNSAHPTGYGYTDLPDNAEMPWGHSVQRKEGCGESLVKGFFVDGLFNGMVQGLTSLVGFSWTGPGGAGFSWSTLGHAWEGVAKLGTALNPTNSLMMLVPGPIGDWSRSSEKTLTQTVAGMVGIDPYAKDPFAAWKSNPWRTGGSSAFNILSFLVPESKAGDAGKAGEAGDAAGLAARAGRVLDVVGDGAKWLKGVTLDGLSKVTSKLGFDKAFHFGDDVKIPEVNRADTGVDNTNLGHGGHTDAPPARTPVDDGAGTHPGSGHDGQPVAPNHGTGDHGTGDHGTGGHGTGDHATGDHATHGGHDQPVHDTQAVKGETTTHTVADSGAWAKEVKARADQSVQHTDALRERNALADKLGVSPKDLTVKKYESTIQDLRDRASTPQELRDVRQLQASVLREQETASALRRGSEDLGTTAAHDYLHSRGEEIIVGDKVGPGRPGTLDTAGLTPDHSVLTVVEAKGGDGARLGTRIVDGVKVQQGSTAYLNELLHLDPELHSYLQAHPDVARSIADGHTRIEYDLVHARNNGRIDVTRMTVDPRGLKLDDLAGVVSPGK